VDDVQRWRSAASSSSECVSPLQIEGFARCCRRLRGASESAANRDSQPPQRFHVRPTNESQANHGGVLVFIRSAPQFLSAQNPRGCGCLRDYNGNIPWGSRLRKSFLGWFQLGVDSGAGCRARENYSEQRRRDNSAGFVAQSLLGNARRLRFRWRGRGKSPPPQAAASFLMPGRPWGSSPPPFSQAIEECPPMVDLASDSHTAPPRVFGNIRTVVGVE